MAFLKKTAAPNRTAALLEFDIQLQAVQLEEIQRDSRIRKSLGDGNPSGNFNDDKCSSDRVQLELWTSNIATASTGVDDNEQDAVGIVHNLTSINEIRNSIFIESETEPQMKAGGAADQGKYFLCRVITPLIPDITVKATSSGVDAECEGDGRGQPFVCIVDESQTSSALRLQISAITKSATFTVPGNGRQRQLTVEKASKILPVGSILLLKNPSNYFYPGSMTLAYSNLEDLIVLDNSNCKHKKILEGVEWKNGIPPKFRNSYKSYSTQQSFPHTVQYPTVKENFCSEESIANLLTAQKFSGAPLLLESVSESHSPNSETDADRIEDVLSQPCQLYQQSTGRGYPVHQWLAAQSSSSLQHLDCAEYEGPVQIQSIPGKGRGLVATSFIPKGSLVLAKRAFVVSFIESELQAVTGSSALSAYDTAAFNAWTDVLNANKIARRLTMTIDSELGKEIYNLYAGPKFEGKIIRDTTIVDIARIMEIVKYNGIANRPGLSSKTASCQDWGLFTQQMTTGLWIRPAYINHSCSDGNSFWKIWGDFLFVRAFADIEPGQEILMSYRGGLTQSSYLERRMALFNGMGFQCDCTLCRLEAGFGKGVNQDIMDLLLEVQCLALNLNGLGSDMYRLTLISIIEEMNSVLSAAVKESGISGLERNRGKSLVDTYLYHPCKLLAMTLLAEAEAEGYDVCDGSSCKRSKSHRPEKLQQVVQLLEKAHDLIQNTSDCSKSVGCSLDLIAVLFKLNEGNQVSKWLEVLKSNLQMVYGCSDGDGNHLDEVLDLFLAKYKISKKSIHFSS